MSKLKHVCIGIQARSTSTRFPGKINELICGDAMLKHVVGLVDKSAFYLNRHSHKTGLRVSHAVLVPTGDPIKRDYATRTMVIEGEEHDVLSRYVKMADVLGATHIVRITADCPLLPDALVTAHIKKAIANDYDYLSNVDPKFRTFPDGYDVEVISRRALDWANEHAKEPEDREHVTTICRTGRFEEQFRVGHVVARADQSHVKWSVDSMDDLERVRVEMDRMKKKKAAAQDYFGRENVHTY